MTVVEPLSLLQGAAGALKPAAVERAQDVAAHVARGGPQEVGELVAGVAEVSVLRIVGQILEGHDVAAAVHEGRGLLDPLEYLRPLLGLVVLFANPAARPGTHPDVEDEALQHYAVAEALPTIPGVAYVEHYYRVRAVALHGLPHAAKGDLEAEEVVLVGIEVFVDAELGPVTGLRGQHIVNEDAARALLHCARCPAAVGIGDARVVGAGLPEHLRIVQVVEGALALAVGADVDPLGVLVHRHGGPEGMVGAGAGDGEVVDLVERDVRHSADAVSASLVHPLAGVRHVADEGNAGALQLGEAHTRGAATVDLIAEVPGRGGDAASEQHEE